MKTYIVHFTDGSSAEIKARTIEYGEHGVRFLGRPKETKLTEIAFVPYATLRILEFSR
ncbi:hypothetical protein [Streptomyces tsukubensis]|uniref:hypothetical protein n=1 Tax=Streptomyces tsukubensis TaxID=83656 RepID=UPI00344BBFA6